MKSQDIKRAMEESGRNIEYINISGSITKLDEIIGELNAFREVAAYHEEGYLIRQLYDVLNYLDKAYSLLEEI